MTTELTLATAERLEQLLDRFEAAQQRLAAQQRALFGGEVVEPFAAGDLPPAVAAGQLIQSSWGNAVRDELLRERNETFAQFDHTGLSSGTNGTFDLGTTNLGPFAYPTRVTIWAIFTFGFANQATNWQFDIFRFLDNTLRSSPTPIQANVNGAWSTTALSWSYAVPASSNAGFKTRATLSGLASGNAWAGAAGIYHVQRTGTP